MACSEGHYEIVKYLLENGADVNISDSNGNSPIDEATKKNFSSIITLLTSHGSAGATFHASTSPVRTSLTLPTKKKDPSPKNPNLKDVRNQKSFSTGSIHEAEVPVNVSSKNMSGKLKRADTNGGVLLPVIKGQRRSN